MPPGRKSLWAALGLLVAASTGVMLVEAARPGAGASESACGNVLAHVPAPVAFSATARFPRDDFNKGNAPYGLTLLRAGRAHMAVAPGTLVGVFDRPATTDRTAQPVLIDHVGPRGLAGARVVAGHEVIVAARRLPSATLAEIASSLNDGGHDGFDVVARQDIATVPGIGSVPVASAGHSCVVSYTSDVSGAAPASDGEQRSVVVAKHAGTAGDLDVLAWWFDNAEPVASFLAATRASRFRADAYAVDDESAVPKAVITAAAFPDGTVALIRTVGFSLDEHAAMAVATRPATDREWAALEETSQARKRGSE